MAQPEWLAIPDWDDADAPEQQWTVKDRIPTRQVTLFSGDGGTGKSTIALHLACAHVTGKDCLGELPEIGPAMFVDAEDDVGVIHRRLDAIRRHYATTFTALSQYGLHILSTVGKEPLMATVGRGNKIEPTPLFDWIRGQAREIKPRLIAIASAANVFAGNELDRSHVTQFISLLTALAIEADGAVILIAHPSVAGMEKDTGLSGSTGWHNAVRARIYLKGLQNGGEEPLKRLEWRKNQYGPAAKAVTLRWTSGMFLVDGGPDLFQKAAKDYTVLAAVEALARRYQAEGVIASPNPTSHNYAAFLFTKEPEAKGFTKTEIHAAIRTLIDRGILKIQTYGKPARPYTKLYCTDP
jgi:RecA-family ATPase